MGFVAFSHDSLHFAYSFKQETGWHLQVDDKKFGPFCYILAHSFVYSPDSSKWACSVSKAEGSVNILNSGEELPAYTRISEFSFSRDSRHFAYIASNGQQTFLIVNGKVNKKFEYFENFMFSPKGKGYSVAAESKGKYYPLLNGRKGTPCNGMNSEFVYSPDGKSVVFVAQTKTGSVLFSNGKETEFLGTRNPMFSPDSKKLAQIESKEKGESVLLGGAKLKGHDRVTSMAFSRTGKRFVFTATMTHMEVLIENGKFNAEYHDVIEPVFTPDESHLFFCAIRDKTVYLVKDGSVFAQHNGEYAYNLTVSDDGKNSAFILFDEKQSFLVINGAREKEYRQICPQKLGYSAYRYTLRGAREATSTGISPYYGTSNYDVIFDSNTTFHMIAARKNAFYRINGTYK